ncbi:MAG: alanine dehydrogenase, partial [Planctomycetota bacterium]
MIIGVPKETKADEYRVGLLAVGAELLTRDGHTVLVQTEAGQGSGFTDSQYSAVSAQILDSAAEIYSRAEMIVKVKEPQP